MAAKSGHITAGMS